MRFSLHNNNHSVKQKKSIMKLEKNQIHWYLPYDLKVLKNKDIYRIADIAFINTFVMLTLSPIKIVNPTVKDMSFGNDLTMVALLLHPMLSLTKLMKKEGYNNGKEFIPLIELSSIIDYKYREGGRLVFNGNILSVYVGLNIPENRVEIGLSETGIDFITYGGKAISLNIYDKIKDFLAYLHFDFQGLIIQGLALDKSKFDR